MVLALVLPDTQFLMGELIHIHGYEIHWFTSHISKYIEFSSSPSAYLAVLPSPLIQLSKCPQHPPASTCALPTLTPSIPFLWGIKAISSEVPFGDSQLCNIGRNILISNGQNQEKVEMRKVQQIQETWKNPTLPIISWSDCSKPWFKTIEKQPAFLVSHNYFIFLHSSRIPIKIYPI